MFPFTRGKSLQQTLCPHGLVNVYTVLIRICAQAVYLPTVVLKLHYFCSFIEAGNVHPIPFDPVIDDVGLTCLVATIILLGSINRNGLSIVSPHLATWVRLKKLSSFFHHIPSLWETNECDLPSSIGPIYLWQNIYAHTSGICKRYWWIFRLTTK